MRSTMCTVISILLTFLVGFLPAGLTRPTDTIDYLKIEPYEIERNEPKGTARLEFQQSIGITQQKTAVIWGNFSDLGAKYVVRGLVVQVHPYRPCQTPTQDATLGGHVAVYFREGIHPSLVGCITPSNQAKFAKNSNSVAVIMGPIRQKDAKKTASLEVDIPVITIDNDQSLKLKRFLLQAANSSAQVYLHLTPANSEHFVSFHDDGFDMQMNHSPTPFDIGLIILLLFILVVAAIVFISIKCHRSSIREPSLRSLAKTALSKMDVQKFKQTHKRKPGSSKTKFMGAKDILSGVGGLGGHSESPLMFDSQQRSNSTYSILSAMEMCSICLEEYKDGQEMRILPCAHDFHKTCVDPWLLKNRTCPLCQYDVVFQRRPAPEVEKSVPILNSTSTTSPSRTPQLDSTLTPAFDGSPTPLLQSPVSIGSAHMREGDDCGQEPVMPPEMVLNSVGVQIEHMEKGELPPKCRFSSRSRSRHRPPRGPRVHARASAVDQGQQHQQPVDRVDSNNLVQMEQKWTKMINATKKLSLKQSCNHNTDAAGHLHETSRRLSAACGNVHETSRRLGTSRKVVVNNGACARRQSEHILSGYSSDISSGCTSTHTHVVQAIGHSKCMDAKNLQKPPPIV